jgi:hypothetical protein
MQRCWITTSLPEKEILFPHLINVLESEMGKYLENTSRFSDVSATMFPSLAKYYLYIHVV